MFFRCKNKCVCTGLCQAKGLKECSVCHEIKRSICSKSSCMVNGRRPQMLTTATSTSVRKRILPDDKSSSESESSISDDSLEEEGDYYEESDKQKTEPSYYLVQIWKQIDPPTLEKIS